MTSIELPKKPKSTIIASSLGTNVIVCSLICVAALKNSNDHTYDHTDQQKWQRQLHCQLECFIHDIQDLHFCHIPTSFLPEALYQTGK